MLVMFNNFTPEKVISGSANSIVPLLIKLFPNEKPNFEKINSQFRALSDIQDLKHLKNENVSNFWKNVSNIKN